MVEERGVAASTSRASDMPSERSLVLLQWVLAGAVLLPGVAAAATLSWARQTHLALLVGAPVGGLLIAVLLGAGPLSRFSRQLALGIAPLVAVGVLFEITKAAQVTGGGTSGVLVSLLVLYLFALGALVPLLIVPLRQTWLALAAVWATVMGSWSTHLTPQQVWWMTWLLTFSLVTIGVTHLSEQARVWRQFKLERAGAVLWPSARTIAFCTVVVALLGMAPLGADEIGLLHALYSRTPFAHTSPLTYHSASGTPVAVLGAPLAVDAPNVAGNTTIVSYTFQQGPQDIPPLLGATLDTFNGTTWTQSATQAMAAPVPGTPPVGATTVKADITVGSLPEVAHNTPFLLGFDQPLHFSVPHPQVRVVSGAPLNSLGVAAWSANTSLPAHTHYTVTSVVIPPSATPIGTLPPTLQEELTQVPPSLLSQLRSTARLWVGSAKTPYDRSVALINAMRAHLVVDGAAKPPAGVNAVAWFLQHKHGNVLLWTTTFILLGRSIGLPLRLAEGYLPGSFDKHLNQMVVHASDASVWAQLAVAGVGWIDLFPGSNLIPITLPASAGYQKAPTPTPTPPSTSKPAVVQPTARQPLSGDVVLTLGVLLVGLVVLVLGLFTLALLRLRRLRTPADPLVGFFARVALLARWAGVYLCASDTPAQATAKVGRAVPMHAAPLREVNSVYEQMRYGRPEARQTSTVNRDAMHTLWRALSRSLGVFTLKRALSPRSKFPKA